MNYSYKQRVGFVRLSDLTREALNTLCPVYEDNGRVVVTLKFASLKQLERCKRVVAKPVAVTTRKQAVKAAMATESGNE